MRLSALALVIASVIATEAVTTPMPIERVIRAVGPHRLKGAVVQGFQRGSKQLGWPTANLDPKVFTTSLDDAEEGVYVGWAAIDGHGGGAVHKAVLSIGWNPVYQNKERTVEAYICHDFDEDFYGAQMKLLICAFFRPQADFKDYEKPFEALIEAITTDVAFGKAALDSDALKGFREDGFFAASCAVVFVYKLATPYGPS